MEKTITEQFVWKKRFYTSTYNYTLHTAHY